MEKRKRMNSIWNNLKCNNINNNNNNNNNNILFITKDMQLWEKKARMKEKKIYAKFILIKSSKS